MRTRFIVCFGQTGIAVSLNYRDIVHME